MNSLAAMEDMLDAVLKLLMIRHLAIHTLFCCALQDISANESLLLKGTVFPIRHVYIQPQVAQVK
jgi:hypothetical protein